MNNDIQKFEKIIRERHSVRSYLDKKIEQVKVDELNELIKDINEQKFKFEYIDEENVKALAGKGSMTKIDLGIVKYHFELGANKKINWK